MPEFITFFRAITSNIWGTVEVGEEHTFAALQSDPTIWFATGRNDRGQLGLNNFINQSSFTRVPGNWSKIICANSTTYGLSAGTTKWFAAGDCREGLFGRSFIEPRFSRFVELSGNWKTLAPGGNYLCAISANTYTLFIAGSSFLHPAGVVTPTLTAVNGRWEDVVGGVNYIFGLSALTHPTLGSDGVWLGAGAPLGLGLFFSGLGGFSTPFFGFRCLPEKYTKIVTSPLGNVTFAYSLTGQRWRGTGENGFGQLGLNSLRTGSGARGPFEPAAVFTFVDLPGGDKIKVIKTNVFGTVVLSGDQEEWFTVGNNASGELGLGLPEDTEYSTFLKVPGRYKDMVKGGFHTMALSGTPVPTPTPTPTLTETPSPTPTYSTIATFDGNDAGAMLVSWYGRNTYTQELNRLSLNDPSINSLNGYVLSTTTTDWNWNGHELVGVGLIHSGDSVWSFLLESLEFPSYEITLTQSYDIFPAPVPTLTMPFNLTFPLNADCMIISELRPNIFINPPHPLYLYNIVGLYEPRPAAPPNDITYNITTVTN